MPAVPAICINPYCLHIFNSGIFIENSTNITISECTSGPCPRCGWMGRIPNAIYSATANEILASLLSLADLNKLKKAIFTIEHHFKKEEFDPSALKKDIVEDVPELNTLIDALPKTRAELYSFMSTIGQWILVLLAILAYLQGTPIVNVNFPGVRYVRPPAASAPQEETHNEKTSKQQSQPTVVKI